VVPADESLGRFSTLMAMRAALLVVATIMLALRMRPFSSVT
jgi:hypothetical protein